MKNILRNLIYGVSEIRLENGFNELFIRECKNNGVSFIDMKISDNYIDIRVKYGFYAKVASLAEKTLMNTVSVKHTGIPFLYYKYRKRIGIPVGLMLACLILFLLSSCIWSVEITGNERLSDEQLLTVLNSSAVSVGVFSDTIISSDIEYMLYNSFEEISWVSVQIVGSRMFIELKERDISYESTDNKEFCNIVAAKNGEVLRADIFEGRGALQPGTPVVKGDLLVSGIVEFRDGRACFVNAKADVWALTKNHITTGTAYKIDIYKPSETENLYGLSFFGLNLPGEKNNKTADSRCATYTQKYLFNAGDVIFPLGLIRQFSVELEHSYVELTAIEAILISVSDYAEAVIKLAENTEICKKSEKISTGDCIYIEGEIECIENIAEKKYFTVEETENLVNSEI